MPRILIIGFPRSLELVYPASVRNRLSAATGEDVGVIGTDQLRKDLSVLAEVEVLMSTWGMLPMNAEFLAAAPRLKAVFYGAGSVKHFVTNEAYERGIVVSSCAAANAVPVAEYTVANILLAQKRLFHFAREVRANRTFRIEYGTVYGNYNRRVGLVSFGMIARLVRQKLESFDLEVAVWDPFLEAEAARAAKVRLLGLEELFATCDVVSLHTPWLPETEDLIRGQHFRQMKHQAVFINTARGAVVHEKEMIEVLAERPDLTAILDVTHPEPPVPESPLYTLPNVILTPHIAGATGLECARLGDLAVDECLRWLAGEPLQHRIEEHMLATIA